MCKSTTQPPASKKKKGLEGPETYKKAMDIKDKNEWQVAMDEEIRCILSHDTWMLVDRSPEGTTIIDPKWVYTFKKSEDGQKSEY